MTDGAEDFAASARLILGLRRRAISDLRLLEAVESLPRRQFAPSAWAAAAASGEAAPIACGQSMTPVFEAAWTLDSAQIKPESRVLLIGLGSGYTSALAARLCRSLVAIDRFRTLVETGRQTLARAGADNVACLQLDALSTDEAGPDAAKFDRIIGFAAFAHEIPSPYVAGALAIGGVLVAPFTTAAGVVLRHCLKTGTDSWRASDLGPCHAPALIAGLASEL